MIVIYKNGYSSNSFECTNYNSLNDNIDFDKYINTERKLLDNTNENIVWLYFIDPEIAAKYPDGYWHGDNYSTNKNIRRSYIKYSIDNKHNVIRRYDGYGLLNTDIPYEEIYRSECNDSNLIWYNSGTVIKFIKPYTDKELTGIILDTSCDDLRIYTIYCYEEDIIYNDDKESIHNNDIISTKDVNIIEFKRLINKYYYMFNEEYVNEINNIQ